MIVWCSKFYWHFNFYINFGPSYGNLYKLFELHLFSKEWSTVYWFFILWIYVYFLYGVLFDVSLLLSLALSVSMSHMGKVRNHYCDRESVVRFSFSLPIFINLVGLFFIKEDRHWGVNYFVICSHDFGLTKDENERLKILFSNCQLQEKVSSE